MPPDYLTVIFCVQIRNGILLPKAALLEYLRTTPDKNTDSSITEISSVLC